MQLTNLQQMKVYEMLGYYNPIQRTKVDFKSPTGSGKTLMASYFISSLIEQNPTKKFIFVIATPSSASLPEFFEKKINKYKADLPYSRFNVEYIASPSSAKTDKTESSPKIIPEQNKVYIFGKASFGKGRILSEREVIDDFILYAKDTGFSLIYIRDEAHIGGKQDNSKEAQNFENLMQNNADFVLKMTATPNYSDPTIQRVILSEKELNDRNKNEGKYLLKTKTETLLKQDMADTEILSDAIENFKKIKENYKSLGVQIRPAMLIQVDNSSGIDKQRKKDFEDSITSIKQALSKANLSWVQYFGNGDKDSNRVFKDKFTLDDITQNDNGIDCVIFKIGPSTGWDIPRACMLVQLRNVCSSSLNTQTIGRIKRNPYPNLEKNDITDKYYIYSNADNIEKEFKVFNYKVKETFIGEELASIVINNKKVMNKGLATAGLKTDIEEYLNEHKNHFIQEYNSVFESINDIFTYKQIRQSVNGKHIYTPITNPFIFLKEYKRFMQSNKYLHDQIKQYTDAFYGTEVKKYISNIEFFNTILFNNHKKSIANIVNKNRQYQPEYKVVMKLYDPTSYSEVYDKDIKTKSTSGQPYLFDITNGGKDNQPLDSKPEEYAFTKICDYSDDFEGKIKVWAKNITSSNVSGEYMDDNNKERNSYFDFIIKFSNNVFLYIEIKGANDIDPQKTAMLEKSYAEYFAKHQKNLFDIPIVISVWKINSNGDITQQSFYDDLRIKEDLNVKNARQLLKFLGEYG